MKFQFKGSKIDKLPETDVLAEYQSNGAVKIGKPGRRGITSLVNGLRIFKFTITEPREAKCCTSWFNEISNANDPSEKLKITKIITIRNNHAMLNHLKRLNCMICHRESPGYDKSPYPTAPSSGSALPAAFGRT